MLELFNSLGLFCVMKTTMIGIFGRHVCYPNMLSFYSRLYLCAGDGEINEEEFYRIMKKTSLF